jgi:hypothetical protein
MDRDEEHPDIPAGTTAQAVFAHMPTSAVLNEAIKRLQLAGFDRADISLPELNPPVERATPDAGAKEPDTGVEAQQSRLMHSSTGGAIGALLAGTAAAATGGAAAAIAGAAIGGGVLVGGIAHVISRGASEAEQEDRDRKAAAGKLVLSVRAPTAEREARAAKVLREVGATRLW